MEVYATSVFGPAETTNNHLEASHKRRRDFIGTHRPLYEFMAKSGSRNFIVVVMAYNFYLLSFLLRS